MKMKIIGKMTVRNINLMIGLVLMTLFTFGCATTGTKSNKQVNIKYTQGLTAVILSESTTSLTITCPKGKKTYQGKEWNRVVQMANSCVKSKKWSKVNELGQHLSQSEPMAPWGSYYLSLYSANKKNYKKALWMVDLSIKKAPQMGLLYYQRAHILWSTFEYDLAIVDLNKALDRNPKIKGANSLLGQIYYRDQEYKKSIKHLLKVQRAKAYKSVALKGLAESYFYLKKYSKAQSFIKRAISLNSRDLSLRYRLAYIEENVNKDKEEALKVYKKIALLKKSYKLIFNTSINLKMKIETLKSTIASESQARKLSSVKKNKTGVVK